MVQDGYLSSKPFDVFFFESSWIKLLGHQKKIHLKSIPDAYFSRLLNDEQFRSQKNAKGSVVRKWPIYCFMLSSQVTEALPKILRLYPQ